MQQNFHICEPLTLKKSGVVMLFVLSLGVFFHAKNLSAQTQFSKKTFTTDNGLPYNFVQHITQDSTGFLWISTWDGLSRYDGYEFRNYYHKPDDSTTFPFFAVDKVVVDQLNNVWVLCANRPVVKYNRKADSFVKFSTNNIPEFLISDLISGTEKDIWLVSGEESKLYHLHLNTNLLETFILTDKNSNKMTNFFPQIFVEPNGKIWFFGLTNKGYTIYTGKFLDELKIQLHAFEPFHPKYFEPAAENKNISVYDICTSNSGKTWLFSTFGLFYLDTSSNSFLESTVPENLRKISKKPYYYWSSEKSGINIIDTNNDEAFNINQDSGKFIGSIFIDSQNTIWSGDISETFENIGLNRYIKTPKIFKHYLNNKNEHGDKHLVFPILKDKNNDIWVGTRGLDYIFKIKPDGTTLKTIICNSAKKNNAPKVKSMVQDKDGIWMGCTDNALIRYNYNTKQFTTTKLNADKANFNLAIHNILKRNNDIVINGSDAVYLYEPISKSLKPVYNYGPGIPVYCMVDDGENGYWLGQSSSTVVHLDSQFKETGKHVIGKGNTNIEHICMGDSSDIWIALMGGGLGHLFPKNKKYETFTTADGLSNNTTYSILKDKNGNLWISTNKGISRFNPKTKHFKNFGKADGLMIEEFNSDAFYLEDDGEMFFGGVGGLVSFYPDSVEKKLSSNIPNRFIITEFNVSGTPRYFENPIYELDTVTLKKGDDNFQLTFASLEFQNPDKIKYRYRLSGKNNSWIETDYRMRNISYANLAPGKYTLKIEATNIYGEWVSSISLIVRVPGYYYQTMWFKLLAVLFIVSLITIFLLSTIRQIHQKAKQKQDLLKLESLRGQMNPHFIFNSLNSINYFISNNDKISANNYIADFSRLIRAFLNNLSNDYIPITKEIEMLNDYLKLEHLRFGDKFDYVLHSEKIENQEEIQVFPGLVQPFIENAIWHGIRNLETRKGFISIEFVQVNNGKVKCIIEDDGVGRRQAQIFKNKLPGKTSKGVEIVLDRLKIAGKINRLDYEVIIEDIFTNRIDCGTRVIVDLPSKQTS